MARDTNRRIEANLRNSEFRKLLEEAKRMVQPGKNQDAVYHILKHMDQEKDENDPSLFWHIPDRQLGEMIGVSKTAVSNARQRLIRERRGIKKVVKNVGTSKAKVIGKGGESVYLYYFPTYQLFNKLHLEVPYFPCNIGKTIGDVKDRISDQIGQQLPEKPKIALIIRTDDCKALETKIHDELKRRGDWLDPKSGADVVGVEWFLTNPAEVEGIFKSIHRTENSNE
ncbi:MAG: GIY-YIG nuclease family protein [Candidatus Poribacteria bacterium]|nr:GIY-YIG nuclease family protein [Candidatus Poribacteria bacterium]